jgi:hypothetical protein
MPSAGRQQREGEATEPLVVRSATAARAGHSVANPWQRADEAAVAMAPASAESPVTERTMALPETRDAAAPRSALVEGPDEEAMRDIGGVVPLELSALPERSAGEPAVEQGVLGSAEIGASTAAAADVSVPAAPPPAEVAMRPGTFVTEASGTSMSVAETAEAKAAPTRPPEATDEVLVALPSLDLPDLPEYHRTQLGQPHPESPLPLAAAPPAAVETTFEPDQPFEGTPLAPQPAAETPEAVSLALLPVAEAASAPAMRGSDIGSIGPDTVHLERGSMEEAAAALEVEVAVEWESGEPSAPRGAFEPPQLEATPIAPDFALADAPPLAETPLASAIPVRDTKPAPVERSVLPAATLALLPLDLQLPTQTVPNPYPQRDPAQRLELAKEMGGDEQTEEAVTLALDWLARHQSTDGRWDGTHFDKDCGACSGIQQVKSNIALTGLSLLAFQAAGHTHRAPGPYRDVVAGGIEWLLSRQQAGGALYGGESLYSHGIAMIALAEAYGMTGDPRLEHPVKSGCEFIYASRHKPRGGWRYTPGQYGDTSVLGWQIMALTSARKAEIDVPDDAFEVARDWLRLVDHPNRPGQYRYQPDRNVTPAMTAEGMFVQQLLGVRRDERKMRGSAQYIVQHPPRWDIDPNTYYWYYATLALFQHQGAAWDRWNEQVKEQLIAHQRQDGSAAGSWDPEGRWSQVAGRIYQTAMCTLTLEVYYRYLPSFVDEH